MPGHAVAAVNYLACGMNAMDHPLCFVRRKSGGKPPHSKNQKSGQLWLLPLLNNHLLAFQRF